MPKLVNYMKNELEVTIFINQFFWVFVFSLPFLLLSFVGLPLTGDFFFGFLNLDSSFKVTFWFSSFNFFCGGESSAILKCETLYGSLSCVGSCFNFRLVFLV